MTSRLDFSSQIAVEKRPAGSKIGGRYLRLVTLKLKNALSNFGGLFIYVYVICSCRSRRVLIGPDRLFRFLHQHAVARKSV